MDKDKDKVKTNTKIGLRNETTQRNTPQHITTQQQQHSKKKARQDKTRKTTQHSITLESESSDFVFLSG
jgi:hypothetical protein